MKSICLFRVRLLLIKPPKGSTASPPFSTFSHTPVCTITSISGRYLWKGITHLPGKSLVKFKFDWWIQIYWKSKENQGTLTRLYNNMKSEMNWAGWDTLRGILIVHFNTDQTYNQKSMIPPLPYCSISRATLTCPKLTYFFHILFISIPFLRLSATFSNLSSRNIFQTMNLRTSYLNLARTAYDLPRSPQKLPLSNISPYF